jgi:uncharacterized protein YndB with AHSA1/START domain
VCEAFSVLPSTEDKQFMLSNSNRWLQLILNNSTCLRIKQIMPDYTIIEKNNYGNTIRFERHFPHSVEEVWNAITNPAILKFWLAEVEGDLKERCKIKLQFTNSRDVINGKILCCRAPVLLEYAWKSTDATESIVKWELYREGHNSSILILTHCLLGDQVPKTVANWRIHLDLLWDVLEGKLGAFSWPDQKWIEEHDKYAQLLG